MAKAFPKGFPKPFHRLSESDKREIDRMVYRELDMAITRELNRPGPLGCLADAVTITIGKKPTHG